MYKVIYLPREHELRIEFDDGTVFFYECFNKKDIDEFTNISVAKFKEMKKNNVR